MQRKRAVILGVGTVAVALGTATLVQRIVPADHPARPQQTATADSALPAIPDSAISPLAADTGPVADPAAFAAPMPTGGSPALGFARGLTGLLSDGPRIAAEALPRLVEMVPAEAVAGAMAELSPEALAGRVAELGTPQPNTAAEPVPAAAPDCTPRLLIVAAPAAMIDIAYDAPCDPGARVVVGHAGLAVTGRTSASGSLDLTLPALEAEAEVTVRLAGRPMTAASVEVPDLAQFDRAAVQWGQDDAFQLHAYEFGAAHGAPGHVSAANPAGPARALNGTGGFLTLLGDEATDWPLLAEVYSFPAGRMTGTGGVEVVLEAAITERTCGREMLGETLEMRRGGAVERSEFHVAMPDCDGVEGYVLLAPLLSDLTLARR